MKLINSICLLLATVLLSQVPVMSAENNDLLKNLNIGKLKSQAVQSSAIINKAENRLLNLQCAFNAFPQSSKINLTLRDVDVPSVLRIIAKEGKKNIVLDQSVKGSISAELKDVSLNEAMQVVLTAQELEARVDGNNIFVASRPAMAKKGLNRKFIKAFKLNNANAVEVAKILEASIFNKGYQVNEAALTNSPGASTPDATQNVSNTSQAGNTSVAASGSSTNQSNLVSSKTIKGKVESFSAGSGSDDASKLASEIKIQSVTPTTQDIVVNNNDGGAIAIPDTRTNSVLVAGLQEDIALAEEAVKCLDKPLRQISLEVSFIQIKKEDSDNFGPSIVGQGSRFAGGFNSVAGAIESGTGLGLKNNSLKETALEFSSVKRLSNEVAFRLNYLVSSNKAKLLANPTILALDGSESLVKITDQIVSKLNVTRTQQGDFIYNPELSDIGIVLNILPKVGDDGYVTMRIRPSITTFLKTETFGVNNYATLISTREILLQNVRVKAGETLAIAGLIRESEIQQIGKIPYVADLPIFGQLFRTKDLSREKSELVVLITPKLIDETSDL